MLTLAPRRPLTQSTEERGEPVVGSNALRWNSELMRRVDRVRVIDLIVPQGGVQAQRQYRLVVLEIPIGGENGPVAAVGGGAD